MKLNVPDENNASRHLLENRVYRHVGDSEERQHRCNVSHVHRFKLVLYLSVQCKSTSYDRIRCRHLSSLSFFSQDFNLARFNVWTRALNSLTYWTAQIVGAMVVGFALDLDRFQRKTRARAGLIGLFAITMGIWGGGYASQKTYTRETAGIEEKLDWTSSNYGSPLVLYLFYGAFDAVWQT